MKIGIDARLYFQTGIGTYLRNFLNNLQRIAPKDIRFFIYIMKDDLSKVRFNNPNFIKRRVLYSWHSLSEQIGFLKTLYQDKLDLMHFTYFSYPVFYQRKFIATIHDLTPLLFKTGRASTHNFLFYHLKYLGFKFVLNNQVRHSNKIIVPSSTIKVQLKNVFGRQIADKTVVIYEGIDQDLIKAKENKSLQSRFRKKFFLYVGNFYPHKNIERLITAFTKVKYDINLVLAGPDDFFAKKIRYLVNELNIGRKIIFYYNPTPSDLVFFYKNALALIHPSLSEGFGLPLVEAAYFGCPIIASDIATFKELLGNNYLSFDPFNINDILKKMNVFLDKKVKFNYDKLLKRYSFKQMADKTFMIYQEVLNT